MFLDDTEITDMPMYRRARMGIGYLPQEASVFRKMTVEENILAVLQMMDLTAARTAGNAASELMAGLQHHAHRATARGTCSPAASGAGRRSPVRSRPTPSFILLDEPFAGIDPIAVEEIMKIVACLKQRGIGVLVTDHNVHETLSITDRAYLLFEGQILKAGTSESLANDPEARKLYLGEKFKLDRYD